MGPGGLPGAAHLARAPHVLVAALVPGDKLVVSGLGVEALDPEHGEVDAGVVAAGLLAHGAGGLLGVGVGQGSVDDSGADAPPITPQKTNLDYFFSPAQRAALCVKSFTN